MSVDQHGVQVTRRYFFSGGGGRGLLNTIEGMNLYPLQFRLVLHNLRQKRSLELYTWSLDYISRCRKLLTTCSAVIAIGEHCCQAAYVFVVRYVWIGFAFWVSLYVWNFTKSNQPNIQYRSHCFFEFFYFNPTQHHITQF